MNRNPLALVSVVLLIATPVAIGSAVYDSTPVILASVAFVGLAFPAAALFPSRRWVAVSVCGLLVLVATVALFRASANEIVE